MQGVRARTTTNLFMGTVEGKETEEWWKKVADRE